VIPVSALHREAVRYSRTLLVTVDIYRAGVPLYLDEPVIGGNYSNDRTSKTRLTSTVTIARNSWEATGIDAKLCRFVVKRGITSIGVADQVTLGTFRVSEVDRSTSGQITLRGDGLEIYIDDARFLTPRTPSFGLSTVQQIKDLITEVLPTATVVARNTTDRQVLATAPWDRERFEAAQTMAGTINSEVFVNYTGNFIIADLPDPTKGVPVAWFDEGNGEVLVDRKETETRDRVYNAISVQGSSTDPNTPPVWAWAYDSDPASDTYFYGPYGQVPMFFTSQFFTTTAQCQATADSMLAAALAENKTLSFNGMPIDFLESGDLVGVRLSDGTMEGHILQKISYTLGVEGGFGADTLSYKQLIADGV
jgi:hypothetical protein